MPTVERTRGIRQALLVRLYDKGIRLKVEPAKHQMDENDPPLDGIKVRRLKGTQANVTPSEKDLIHDHEPQLVHMLRYDFKYAQELVRDVMRQTMKEYPIGRGCDLTPQHDLLEKAQERLAKEDMHGLWYYLDDALMAGLELCEEYRDRPILTKEKK